MPNYKLFFKPRSEPGEANSHVVISAVLKLHSSADYFDVIGTITDVAGEHSDSDWIGEQIYCLGTDFFDDEYEGVTSRKRLEQAFSEALLPSGFTVRAFCDTELSQTGDNT